MRHFKLEYQTEEKAIYQYLVDDSSLTRKRYTGVIEINKADGRPKIIKIAKDEWSEQRALCAAAYLAGYKYPRKYLHTSF
ncbi:MAG: hypothetical protein HDR54_04480 [Treponema sp.]|nr:hypothetical protein [Treponema sp.]MBD5408634.1 hypothetical protein [Treponema sp.]MBD5410751.1 hypothetical protein [Treponema sp.]MBD5442605.1 hypothetical protein [Treponema sp.]